MNKPASQFDVLVIFVGILAFLGFAFSYLHEDLNNKLERIHHAITSGEHSVGNSEGTENSNGGRVILAGSRED